MKLLVVGAGGFIGRHLAALAERRGIATLRTDLAPAAPGAIPFELGRDRITGLLPPGFLGAGAPLAAVICAAESRIDYCAREPEATRRVNVDATAELALDLAALGVRSVVLSTDNVFDGARGGYAESDAPAPVNEYGRQKLALEERVLREAPGALALRLAKQVGDDPAEAHPLSDWWGQLSRGETIRCIRGQVLSWTWVEDTAAAILRALELGLEGRYHVAGPERWSRAQLAGLLAARAGRAAAIVEQDLELFGFVDRRPLDTTLDGGRFARATGIEFAGMAALVDRFLARLSGSRMSTPGILPPI